MNGDVTVVRVRAVSPLKPNSLLENNCPDCIKCTHVCSGEPAESRVPKWQDSLAWLLAGSRVRIGSYFWKGVCVGTGRLVRSAKIFPTAATVGR